MTEINRGLLSRQTDNLVQALAHVGKQRIGQHTQRVGLGKALIVQNFAYSPCVAQPCPETVRAALSSFAR